MTAAAAPRPLPSHEGVGAGDLGGPRPVGPLPRGLRVAGLWGLLALLVGLFALAVFHAQITQRAHDLGVLERELSDRAAQVAALELEVATLESPARLTDAAESLGLRRPSVIQHLVPEPDVVARVLFTPEDSAAEASPGVRSRTGDGAP